MSLNPITNRSGKSPPPAVENPPLQNWLNDLQQGLRGSGQRGLVILDATTKSQRQLVFGELVQQGDLLISDQTLDGVETLPARQAENLLGLQFDRVLYQCDEEPDANILCMLAGLVCAGGLLLIVSGEQSKHRFFFRWFSERLTDCRVFYDLRDTAALPSIGVFPESQQTPIIDGLTAEQRELLEALQQWRKRSPDGVFLLTADRGRGKSTALGRFAASIVQDTELVVCAPSRRQAQLLLDQLDEVSQTVYIAPDEMIRQRRQVDLLIVDEAAMIPGSVLWQCLELAQRVLLATTTGGYEGTGQGFLLRFVEALQQQRELTRHSLEQPVRWGRDDLLEQALNRALLLGSAPLIDDAPAKGEVDFERVESTELRNSPGLLEAVYRLLAAAHYRTRPSDLARLLDDETQTLFIARSGSQVVGVLLLNPEGGFDAELSEQIFLGRRRPQGHLLAQMLTAQAGVPQFASYRGQRIQRIVVDPALRRRGIGRRLVQQALAYTQSEGGEYLGSCFALDQVNAAFWRDCGFELVHIAAGQGTTTARQTVVVMQALGAAAESAAQQLRQRIYEALPQWLLTYCRDIYWRDVEALLEFLRIDYPLTPLQQQEIHAFAEGHRGFDYAQSTLQRYLIGHLPQAPELDQGARRLLIEKLLQNHSWGDVAERVGLPGRKALLTKIRQAIRDIDEHA